MYIQGNILQCFVFIVTLLCRVILKSTTLLFLFSCHFPPYHIFFSSISFPLWSLLSSFFPLLPHSLLFVSSLSILISHSLHLWLLPSFHFLLFSLPFSPSIHPFLLYAHAGTLEMDKFAYCGEEKQAIFTGIGGSVTLMVDGVETPAIITRNTVQPLYRGGFEFTSSTTIPTSRDAYTVEFIIHIHYNMTQEISGKQLAFTVRDDDNITGLTDLKSMQAIHICSCIPIKSTCVPHACICVKVQ